MVLPGCSEVIEQPAENSTDLVDIVPDQSSLVGRKSADSIATHQSNMYNRGGVRIPQSQLQFQESGEVLALF
jgi:hypothetical protein